MGKKLMRMNVVKNKKIHRMFTFLTNEFMKGLDDSEGFEDWMEEEEDGKEEERGDELEVREAWSRKG